MGRMLLSFFQVQKWKLFYSTLDETLTPLSVSTQHFKIASRFQSVKASGKSTTQGGACSMKEWVQNLKNFTNFQIRVQNFKNFHKFSRQDTKFTQIFKTGNKISKILQNFKTGYTISKFAQVSKLGAKFQKFHKILKQVTKFQKFQIWFKTNPSLIQA